MIPREDLKAYLDHELTPDQQSEVARELETNPSLAAEAEAIRQISETIRSETRFPQPEGMAKTLAAMARPSVPAWRRPSRLAWAGAALTLVLAILVVPTMMPALIAAKNPSATGESASTEVAKMAAPMGAASSPVEMQSGAPMADRVKSGGAEFRSRQLDASARNVAPSASAVPKPNLLIARTADMVVTVPDVSAAFEQAARTVQRLGGYIAASDSFGAGRTAIANLTVRVPVARFDEARRAFRNLGRMEREQLGSEDVTTQVADTEDRLRAMRAEERQYLEIMKGARRVNDILAVRDRLAQVRQEIESLDAIRKSLRSRAAESTIQLQLAAEPPKPPARKAQKGWFQSTWDGARDLLATLGRAAIAGLLYVVVLIPVWFPLVLLGWWLNRRGR